MPPRKEWKEEGKKEENQIACPELHLRVRSPKSAMQNQSIYQSYPGLALGLALVHVLRGVLVVEVVSVVS